MKVKDEKNETYSTGNVRIHIGDIFRIVGIRQYMFTKKITHSERRVMTKGTLHKADLPKTILQKCFDEKC